MAKREEVVRLQEQLAMLKALHAEDQQALAQAQATQTAMAAESAGAMPSTADRERQMPTPSAPPADHAAMDEDEGMPRVWGGVVAGFCSWPHTTYRTRL